LYARFYNIPKVAKSIPSNSPDTLQSFLFSLQSIVQGFKTFSSFFKLFMDNQVDMSPLVGENIQANAF